MKGKRYAQLIRADMAHINSVARIPTRDPQDAIVVDEE
jgi:hypothetical protein